jgi:hypothetical protein
MCGNFGLLMVGNGAAEDGFEERQNFNDPHRKPDKRDTAIQRSMYEVGKLRGLRVVGMKMLLHNGEELSGGTEEVSMLSPLEILEAQTACTEIRGGQAGGISCIETVGFGNTKMTRVRCVARKRHPLAADLAKLYRREAPSLPDANSVVTFIGHTRFATASVNSVPELHPHEWSPMHDEDVWLVRNGR